MKNNGFYRRGYKEKYLKPSLFFKKIDNNLRISVCDGKRKEVIDVKIPLNEMNFSTHEVAFSFLKREFGEGVLKMKINEIIKLIMDWIDTQKKE